MRDVLEAVTADEQRARAKADANRERFPEIAAVIDSLRGQGAEVRVRFIELDGQLVAGKPHPPDPPSWCEVSGEMVERLGMFGRK